MFSGLLNYFPDAMAAVARLSKIGNDKHNPGEPLHWSKGKSNDHADCLLRHLAERGMIDASDGVNHSVKVAWRALADLQTLIEDGFVMFANVEASSFPAYGLGFDAAYGRSPRMYRGTPLTDGMRVTLTCVDASHDRAPAVGTEVRGSYFGSIISLDETYFDRRGREQELVPTADVASGMWELRV